MMNNRIPVVLVFCLVAVSVSLAQPLVEQDVSNGWQSYTAQRLAIKGPTNTVGGGNCYYVIKECVIKGEVSEVKCIIKNDKGGPGRNECPAPASQFIILTRIGEFNLYYSGLKLTNPLHTIPESAEGIISTVDSRLSGVKFLSNSYYMILTKN
eukprot:Nk52_evm13s160 gene=Nk52_evmTU13s160